MTWSRVCFMSMCYIALLLLLACESHAREWTDNTGQFHVEAELVDLRDGEVRLKRRDGKIITISLERLSQVDQHYAKRTAAQPGDPPQTTRTVLGPSALPRLPDTLEWPEQTKTNLKHVVAGYDEDPVSACLTFSSVINREKKPPTDEQREWLDRATEAARPEAVDRLRRDFKRAVDTDDLRVAMIVKVVADKVQQQLLDDADPSIAVLKSRVLSGKSRCQSVWQIAEAKAKYLPGEFTERLGMDFITITPKQGFVLLKVSTTVTNVSPDSDPPYTPWVFSDFKRTIFHVSREWKNKKADLGKPHRLADGDSVFLLTPGGDMLQCLHTCLGSHGFRETSMVVKGKTGKGTAMSVGRYVEQGEQLELHAVFSVPTNIEDFRMFILDAMPAPVTVSEQ